MHFTSLKLTTKAAWRANTVTRSQTGGNLSTNRDIPRVNRLKLFKSLTQSFSIKLV